MQNDYDLSLLEAIADSAVLVDKTGRIIDWNTNATTLFGYPKKEVIGRSINILYRQSHPFVKIIQETLPQQKKWSAETEFVRKNGIKGICKTQISLIPAPQHNKAVALILHHNISDYKNIENELRSLNQKIGRELKEHLGIFYVNNALLIKNLASHEQIEKVMRESELRFHLLAENATDVISRHSADGTYLYASPSCKTLLGFGSHELVGRNAYKFVHYEDVSKLKKAFNRRKEVPGPHSVTYRVRRKDGEYRWFESSIRTIYDENNKTIREIQSASRDVTDHILDKKARLRGQQLAHVFRLSTMEEMASGMAHEISQPLAAVINYTQGCARYLQNETHDRSQLTEIMKKAVAQAERAGEVIHRLKNFFCKGQLIKTPCKLNSVIRETVSLIRNDLTLSKTKIDFDLMKEIPPVFADKIQVQQVLLNLIQNAIEAMKEIDIREKRIQIQTRLLDTRTIEVIVSDTGPGFTKDVAHKVFEPFFTTKAHGRGMGLAICRSIIEAHGGKFVIYPNTSHHSSIRFSLPIT